MRSLPDSTIIPFLSIQTLFLLASDNRICFLSSSNMSVFSPGVPIVIIFLSSSKVIFNWFFVTIVFKLFFGSKETGVFRLRLYKLPTITGWQGSSLMNCRTTSSSTSGRNNMPTPLLAYGLTGRAHISVFSHCNKGISTNIKFSKSLLSPIFLTIPICNPRIPGKKPLAAGATTSGSSVMTTGLKPI